MHKPNIVCLQYWLDDTAAHPLGQASFTVVYDVDEQVPALTPEDPSKA